MKRKRSHSLFKKNSTQSLEKVLLFYNKKYFFSRNKVRNMIDPMYTEEK